MCTCRYTFPKHLARLNFENGKEASIINVIILSRNMFITNCVDSKMDRSNLLDQQQIIKNNNVNLNKTNKYVLFFRSINTLIPLSHNIIDFTGGLLKP